MDLMLFYRYVHIFSAIFWVGTTLFMVAFLEPTIKALGPEGGKFMQKLTGGTRFSLVMGLAGWLTVLSGLLMYSPVTGSFNPGIMFESRLVLTLGAVAGFAAGIVGTAMQGRSSGRLLALGKEIAAQGGPPSPEQAAEMGALQATIRRGSRLTAVLMVLAVFGMVW
jgi:uncharacterized membrane protein